MRKTLLAVTALVTILLLGCNGNGRPQSVSPGVANSNQTTGGDRGVSNCPNGKCKER